MKRLTPVLNLALACGIALITLYVWRDHPPRVIPTFTMSTLEQALSQKDVSAIGYSASSQEITGSIRAERQAVYGGDQFRLPGPIPLSMYHAIQQQGLATTRFLGPIEGLRDEKDFKETLKLHPHPRALPIFTGLEDSVFELRALGMSLGELRMRVLEPVLVQDKPAYHFKVEASTSSSFAGVYRIQDEAETYVQASDFHPLGFSLLVNETDRYGSQFETRSTPERLQIRRRLVSRTRGLEQTEVSEHQDPSWQNMLSAIFDLRRRDWSQEQSVCILDQGKKIVIRGQRLREESLQTPLGLQQAYVIEPRIEVDGALKAKPKVSVWIQAAKPHALLKIEADIKIGRVTAELSHYSSERIRE